MAYGLTQTIAPTEEPVTLEQAAEHLRLTTNTQDARLDDLIRAARDTVERITGRQLMTATWALRLDEFPSREIDLFYPPAQSVTSITYYDTAGDSQTLSTDVYELDAYTMPPRVVLKPNQWWESSEAGKYNAVTVTWVAGYTAMNLVPPSIRHAILMAIEDMNEHSGRQSELRLQENATFMALLQPYIASVVA